MKRVIVSGYFSPLEAGHVELFAAAKEMSDQLIVIVNNDSQEKLKRGRVSMKATDREQVVASVRYVDEVVSSVDAALRVSDTLTALRERYPKDELIFANGGFRDDEDEIPESDVCEKLDIKLAFRVGAV